MYSIKGGKVKVADTKIRRDAKMTVENISTRRTGKLLLAAKRGEKGILQRDQL